MKFAATNGSNPYATRISRFVAIIPSGHGYATLALQNGVDVKTVSNNLGHSTTAFTMDKYGHVTETMMKDSAEKMQRFIESL